MPAPRDSGLHDRADERRVERDSSGPPPASGKKVSARRTRTRAPVRVDDVGDAAVAIASRAAPSSAPRLLKTRAELTAAPIDPRDAFVISLIDGKMSVASIVDVSGMPRSEIAAILDRLVQLGIIALPNRQQL